MVIHARKAGDFLGDFHSKLTSCSACRRAGRMAIHAVKVEDFHSKNEKFHKKKSVQFLLHAVGAIMTYSLC